MKSGLSYYFPEIPMILSQSIGKNMRKDERCSYEKYDHNARDDIF